MKTINILKIFINVFYILLLLVAIAGFLGFITALIFNEHLPFFLQGFKSIITVFDWKLFSPLFLKTINFVLFILSVYYLKKCIKSFSESDFYSETVVKNLKRAGSIFVFIGGSTILIQIVAFFILINRATVLVEGFTNSFLRSLTAFIGAIDVESIFLIIIGLFFLLFSNAFANAKELKRDNDLTI